MAAQIYLYTGPEFGERNDSVEEIKSSLEKKFGQTDNHLFYLSETPLSQAMTILESGTLFSSAVCVVCKGAELIKKKDEISMISSWINSNPAESSVLVLISDEISVDSKLEKLISSEKRKKFWAMTGERPFAWVCSFFNKNGYKIQEEAAHQIVDMIENNTQELRQECSRFFMCFEKDHEITTEDVDSILAHNREENAFTLFDALADDKKNPVKRLENALLILQKIRLSKESSSVMLIAGLSSCFRKVRLWKKLCSENGGYQPDDFTLKTNGFAYKSVQAQYSKASKMWTDGQAVAILANLSSADMEIRSGGSLLEDVILQKVIYEIVIGNGRQISSCEY